MRCCARAMDGWPHITVARGWASWMSQRPAQLQPPSPRGADQRLGGVTTHLGGRGATRWPLPTATATHHKGGREEGHNADRRHHASDHPDGALLRQPRAPHRPRAIGGPRLGHVVAEAQRRVAVPQGCPAARCGAHATRRGAGTPAGLGRAVAAAAVVPSRSATLLPILPCTNHLEPDGEHEKRRGQPGQGRSHDGGAPRGRVGRQEVWAGAVAVGRGVSSVPP
mmetsp:Transcript_36748/g.96239  ORF Transcript_36748/g.96239 Transcript_36748/m.96239 type:complete len:224 (-) Transcript_36748:36-707(-)